MRKIKIIGLTGQSGAGKSTAAKTFAEQGAYVVNADELVRRLYTPGSVCLNAVAAAFGSDVINSDGGVNRQILAQRAFESKQNTQMLNGIVHPFVTTELIKEIKKAISNGKSVVLYDAPQLFESGFDVLCDLTVGVCADESVRIKRIRARDGIDEERARQRISAQLDEEFFKKNCDIVIENNGEQTVFCEDIKRASDAVFYEGEKL